MQARQPRMQVLILPGNPGSAAFYRVFMQQLFDAFDGAADVMAVSHVGHDCGDISRGAVWGLDCQVKHKVQLVQELTAPGRPPLVVLAHSIGSFITLQVSQFSSSAVVCFCLPIMAYIHIQRCPMFSSRLAASDA